MKSDSSGLKEATAAGHDAADSTIILSLRVPPELKRFSMPALMPGENLEDFECLHQMLIDDIRPRTNIEWLWLFDLAELSWEILRYRKLRTSVFQAFRETAIEATLNRLDGAGMPRQCNSTVQRQTRLNVIAWREDPDAAREIEQRLARNGFDPAALNAEVFIRAQPALAMFDALMQSAQTRRIMLLKEMTISREFRARAKLASETLLAGRPNAK